MTVNIAYSCDQAYIHHTGISIISLLEYNKDLENIVIYFIEKEVGEISIRQLTDIVKSYGRTIKIFSFSAICSRLNISVVGRHIETVYAKLFFSELPGIGKILYLDSDTIINGSLAELWNMDLDDNLIAGVETITVNSKKDLGLS
jgi:lipopolysaccharide biosynthesis glycosyltransferase